jgi:hypothetical protein
LSPQRAIRACALAATLATACGGTTTVTPGRVAGGTVQGDYVLRIVPAPACAAPAATLSFPVTAYAADTVNYAGIQILPRGQVPLLPPAERLAGDALVIEAELQYVTPEVRGGVGTPTFGAQAQEGFFIFAHAIAEGSVSHVGTDPGEVLDGTLAGELEFGGSATDPGGLGSCASEAHRWSLKRT